MNETLSSNLRKQTAKSSENSIRRDEHNLQKHLENDSIQHNRGQSQPKIEVLA